MQTREGFIILINTCALVTFTFWKHLSLCLPYRSTNAIRMWNKIQSPMCGQQRVGGPRACRPTLDFIQVSIGSLMLRGRFTPLPITRSRWRIIPVMAPSELLSPCEICFITRRSAYWPCWRMLTAVFLNETASFTSAVIYPTGCSSF